MMIERRTLEALDACRPGSDDLQNTDHHELAEVRSLVQEDAAVQEAQARVQHFDTKIESVMDEVPLPAGLADRVKQHLANSAVSVVAATKEQATSEQTVSLPESAKASRRTWMWGALAGIAATVLVALGINFFQGDPEIALTRESLDSLSREWHENAQNDPSGWNSDLSLAAKDRPFPIDGFNSRPLRFKNLSLAGDRSAVAYDVSFGSHQATVIVYKGQAAGLDLVPPQNPLFSTQGVCVGLWQRDGLLFALVVEGNPANYRQLLLSNQGNLG